MSWIAIHVTASKDLHEPVTPRPAAFGLLHYVVAAVLGGHGACLALRMEEAGSKWSGVLAAVAGFAEGALGMLLWKAGIPSLCGLVRLAAACWMFRLGPRTLMGQGQDFVAVTNLAWVPHIFAGLAIYVFWPT